LVSGQVAYGDERTQALVAGELRVRHGNYVSPNVTTASLRVASASFGTLEPAVILGYDFIQERRAYGPGYMAARDLRIALGGGRSFGDETRGFVLGQLSVGGILERDGGGYVASCGGERCGMDMDRYAAQLDVVLEARVTSDGDVRVSIGFDFDPFRLWHAPWSF
jgi:hypothetical protein